MEQTKHEPADLPNGAWGPLLSSMWVKRARRRRTSLDLFDGDVDSQDNRLIITCYSVVLFDRFQCLDVLLLKAQSSCFALSFHATMIAP